MKEEEAPLAAGSVTPGSNSIHFSIIRLRHDPRLHLAPPAPHSAPLRGQEINKYASSPGGPTDGRTVSQTTCVPQSAAAAAASS